MVVELTLPRMGCQEAQFASEQPSKAHAADAISKKGFQVLSRRFRRMLQVQGCVSWFQVGRSRREFDSKSGRRR